MSGLQKICKMYGKMEVKDAKGNSVIWIWDYKKDQPRLKSEMSKEELKENQKARNQSKLK